MQWRSCRRSCFLPQPLTCSSRNSWTQWQLFFMRGISSSRLRTQLSSCMLTGYNLSTTSPWPTIVNAGRRAEWSSCSCACCTIPPRWSTSLHASVALWHPNRHHHQRSCTPYLPQALLWREECWQCERTTSKVGKPPTWYLQHLLQEHCLCHLFHQWHFLKSRKLILPVPRDLAREFAAEDAFFLRALRNGYIHAAERLLAIRSSPKDDCIFFAFDGSFKALLPGADLDKLRSISPLHGEDFIANYTALNHQAAMQVLGLPGVVCRKVQSLPQLSGAVILVNSDAISNEFENTFRIVKRNLLTITHDHPLFIQPGDIVQVQEEPIGTIQKESLPSLRLELWKNITSLCCFTHWCPLCRQWSHHLWRFATQLQFQAQEPLPLINLSLNLSILMDSTTILTSFVLRPTWRWRYPLQPSFSWCFRWPPHAPAHRWGALRRWYAEEGKSLEPRHAREPRPRGLVQPSQQGPNLRSGHVMLRLEAHPGVGQERQVKAKPRHGSKPSLQRWQSKISWRHTGPAWGPSSWHTTKPTLKMTSVGQHPEVLLMPLSPKPSIHCYGLYPRSMGKLWSMAEEEASSTIEMGGSWTSSRSPLHQQWWSSTFFRAEAGIWPIEGWSRLPPRTTCSSYWR